MACKAFCDLATPLLCGLFSYSPLPPLSQLCQSLQLYLLPPPWRPQSLGLYPCLGWISFFMWLHGIYSPNSAQASPPEDGGVELESPGWVGCPCLGLRRTGAILTTHFLTADSPLLWGALLICTAAWLRAGPCSFFSPAPHTWQQPWVI